MGMNANISQTLEGTQAFDNSTYSSNSPDDYTVELETVVLLYTIDKESDTNPSVDTIVPNILSINANTSVYSTNSSKRTSRKNKSSSRVSAQKQTASTSVVNSSPEQQNGIASHPRARQNYKPLVNTGQTTPSMDSDDDDEVPLGASYSHIQNLAPLQSSRNKSSQVGNRAMLRTPGSAEMRRMAFRGSVVAARNIQNPPELHEPIVVRKLSDNPSRVVAQLPPGPTSREYVASPSPLRKVVDISVAVEKNDAAISKPTFKSKQMNKFEVLVAVALGPEVVVSAAPGLSNEIRKTYQMSAVAEIQANSPGVKDRLRCLDSALTLYTALKKRSWLKHLSCAVMRSSPKQSQSVFEFKELPQVHYISLDFNLPLSLDIAPLSMEIDTICRPPVIKAAAPAYEHLDLLGSDFDYLRDVLNSEGGVGVNQFFNIEPDVKGVVRKSTM